jgi:hypothetical protein
MNQWELDNYNETRFRQEIDLMHQAIEAYKRKISKPHVVAKLTAECEERIINAALYLGEFDLAYKYMKSREQLKLATRLMMSLLRDEHESCKCSIDSVPVQNGVAELPLFFLWRRMRNPKLGVWVDVYKCSKCNFMTTNTGSHATKSARNLQRVRATNVNKKLKDHEALKQ